MKNEKLIQAACKSRETQYEAPCLANGAAHSEDYSRRVERLINKTDKSRLSFLFTSGAARVAAAALALAAVLVIAFVVITKTANKTNVADYSGKIKAAVKSVEPLEVPNIIVFIWKALDENTLKNGVTTVFTGVVTDVTEISMSYEYMDQNVVDYWSLLTVTVKDAISGDLTNNDTATVLFELSSHRYYDGITIEKGKEYVFYLIKSSESESILDYTPLADYIYHVPAICFVPIAEPQVTELLEAMGAEEGTCGEEFIEVLRDYYK
ncbi:MAG: hypothetical protein J6U75_00155 [Clostridia bacterium]|nr:hypothetical protein [Clostridia bacterium]